VAASGACDHCIKRSMPSMACAFPRKTVCAARNSGPPRKLFSCRSGDRSVLARLACVIANIRSQRVVVLMRRNKSAEKKHFPETRIARVDVRGRPCAGRTAHASSLAAESRAADRENNCRKVLTLEKTVFRFPPSRRDLQKRVSRKTRTTCSTTKPSALKFLKVDAGNISPAKGSIQYSNTDLHRPAMQVFYCRRRRAGHQASVPARHARRRLVAGPIPVALFCTGLQYPKVN
jgi:hypothetical protein